MNGGKHMNLFCRSVSSLLCLSVYLTAYILHTHARRRLAN